MKATNSYVLHMTTTQMQSLFAYYQTERHLLLSPPSNPSATCLRRNIVNHNFEYWAMKHQTPSKLLCPGNHRLPICSTKHRVNAVERAIQNFKNRFISVLCSTDPNFPMQLWDQLLPQAEDSLNMFCIVHDDPTKEAYEILHRKLNFNTHCKILKATTDAEFTRVTLLLHPLHTLCHTHPCTRTIWKWRQKSISSTLALILQSGLQYHQPWQSPHLQQNIIT